MPEWTATRVRNELPNVPVRFGKNKPVVGRVTGRVNPRATVTVDNHGTITSVNPPWLDLHFSWEDIAHALNTGTPLPGD